MRLLILENYDLASEFAAKYVKKKIRQYKPGPDRLFVLGLPTGSSPLGMYKKLVEFCKNGQLSFEYVATFNMDEYVGMQRRSATAKCGPPHPRFLKIDLRKIAEKILTGLPRNHPESYHSFMFTNFFRHIDINPANVHILDGNAKDLEFECSEFERKIKELGGIQLFIGGIGPDGHIAFNEPGSSLVSRTRVKTLAVETVQANARFFGNDISKVPKMALTVGVGTVMDAKEVMILITGAHKAYALHRAIEEGVSHMWTVSAFQMHPYVLFVCDEDATLELKVKTVKYFKGMLDHHLKLAEEEPEEQQPANASAT